MYCGYINFLIVLIFVTLVFLTIVRLLLFLLVISNKTLWVLRFKFFYVSIFADCEILFNNWNLLFLLIVLFIRVAVLFFSCSYMRVYAVNSFIFLYLMFVLSMSWLVLNSNFYWIILGWDGLGVVSFLLIIFYINQERTSNGLFTIFQNRVGDLFFVLFILGRYNLRIISSIILIKIRLVLILGSIVKRAQFPFNSWLLAAIRAPTPISSLVHSSTLVVAGVYILLQFRYCLGPILIYLKWFRIITLILRVLGLLVEIDIKKLVAYSTINHVALIIYLLRIKLYKITYFHLNIHAIFKSLIFMCFGFVILASFHRQDCRLTSLVYLNPLTKITYSFACLCLIGLPFLRAFFSKDFIIEKRLEFRGQMRERFFLLFFLGVRIFYSLKLLQLNKIIFSYQIIEKQRIGIIRILFIVGVRVVFINLFISYVFSVSLEVSSFKFLIYLLMFFFLLINLLLRIKLKLNSYNKIINFIEIWNINWYSVDLFIYWTFQNSLRRLNFLNNLKFILLINWWVLIGCLFLF